MNSNNQIETYQTSPQYQSNGEIQRQITSEMLAAYREYHRELRLTQDLRHQQRNEQVGRVCWGIGAVFVGAIGLLLAGAIFAAANRPVVPPPPRINDSCIAFCGGGNG